MMEDTIELPNGYMLMDTVCLLNYIEGKSPDIFDYKQVEKYVRDKGWWIVITPNTLYESVQCCTDIEFIRKRWQEITKVENLWVVDVKGILSKEYHFVPAKVCLDWISFSPDVMRLRLFGQKRYELRLKVYESLYDRIIVMAELIAYIYLVITERGEDGTYPKDFDWWVRLIFGYFRNKPQLRMELTRFLAQAVGLPTIDDKKRLDAKDYMGSCLEYMVTEIIHISRIQYEHHIGINPYADNNEFNDRIVEKYWEMEKVNPYPRKVMAKRYNKEFLKMEPKRTIDVLVEEKTRQYPEMLRHMYKKLVADWFSGGIGKPFMNTLIDYDNMHFLNTKGVNDWVYITEEDKFVDYILDSKEETLAATRRFYEQYYLKKRSL